MWLSSKQSAGDVILFSHLESVRVPNGMTGSTNTLPGVKHNTVCSHIWLNTFPRLLNQLNLPWRKWTFLSLFCHCAVVSVTANLYWFTSGAPHLVLSPCPIETETCIETVEENQPSIFEYWYMVSGQPNHHKRKTCSRWIPIIRKEVKDVSHDGTI